MFRDEVTANHGEEDASRRMLHTPGCFFWWGSLGAAIAELDFSLEHQLVRAAKELVLAGTEMRRLDKEQFQVFADALDSNTKIFFTNMSAVSRTTRRAKGDGMGEREHESVNSSVRRAVRL